MATPEELGNLYRTGRLLPFVGAGVSASLSWGENGEQRCPSWGELVEHAAKLLGFEQPELARLRGTDLQILEFFRSKKESFAELRNWLGQTMNPPDDALGSSPIHQALAELDNCRILYTTNFDDLLERSLGLLQGQPPRVVAVESQATGDRDEVEVVKFHGDLNHPDHMVVSESDYEDRLSFRAPMDHRFKGDFLNRVILFIGYSFRDPNVSYLFGQMNKDLGEFHSASGNRAFIIFPDPSDFEYELFRRRNIGVIPVTRSNITEDTAEVLRKIKG